jgi:signal transduction histidine kinase
MYFGITTLLVIVIVLSVASFQGALKFRKLTRSIHERSMELPEAAELGQEVSQLRSLLAQLNHQTPELAINAVDQSHFKMKLMEVEKALRDYEFQLQSSQAEDPRIAEKTQETEFVIEFRRKLSRIKQIINDGDPTDWVWHREHIYNPLESELSELQSMATEIPVFMQQRMENFALRAKTQYHAWMTVTLVLGLAAVGLIGMVMVRFRSRIIRPLETLVAGSREVAGGNYDHRIQLDADDEISELGDALNSMTQGFQSIQADLNSQVQQRTKEVVRSEQMASVGFLAAGVAHEINNPLASIAWSAESLESRIDDILHGVAENGIVETQAEIDDMKKYLRRIQDEAFRVKGITGSLLDFARMGDAQKTTQSLAEIIESVIEIVKPLGKYRRRNLSFSADPSVLAFVNEQEMKQVMLNLITNALSSVAEDGNVMIQLKSAGSLAVCNVIDDGCGMDDEVKKHLFDPFFTRRNDGQGTGLGLSITYRIIEEHGGKIQALSKGPGMGATFTVTLPLVTHEQRLAKAA